MIDKVAQGKANRKTGRLFEKKVREELIRQGFIVDRWTNNIDPPGEIVAARSNRFNSRTTGFPDFMAFRKYKNEMADTYQMFLIECKTRKYLDKDEREKVEVYKKLGFKVWVAFPHKDGIGFQLK